MNFKNYRREGEQYVLKKPLENLSVKTIVILGLFIATVLFILNNFTDYTHNNEDFMYICLIPCCVVFIFLLVKLQCNFFNLIIVPKENLVLSRVLHKKMQHNFDQFVDFKVIQMRLNGLITINYIVVMYFKGDKKNIEVKLSTVMTEKKAAELIEETKQLLKK